MEALAVGKTLFSQVERFSLRMRGTRKKTKNKNSAAQSTNHRSYLCTGVATTHTHVSLITHLRVLLKELRHPRHLIGVRPRHLCETGSDNGSRQHGRRKNSVVN